MLKASVESMGLKKIQRNCLEDIEKFVEFQNINISVLLIS